MTVEIGPYTLYMTDAEAAVLAPMVQTFADVYLLPDGTSRVQPCVVKLRDLDKMPWADEDATVRSRGHYDNHVILIARYLLTGNPTKARKTWAHESYHHLADDWMLSVNRQGTKPLFDPPVVGKGWPSEVAAVYGSAAVGGFDDPPYTDYYDSRSVPKANWPAFKAESLADHRPVMPPEPPGPEPEPPQVIEVPAGTSIVVKAI